MDLRTKSQGGKPTYNVAVGRAGRVLVFVMGKEGVRGGGLNKKAYSMTKYVGDSGFELLGKLLSIKEIAIKLS
uniref:Uncharacterized protein n=1 Tax=Pseudonaja textilis TaxID=8673 RepID=A0A670Z3B1_PSETE